MAKVKFTTAEGYERFSFFRPDGSEVVVDEKGYATDDAGEIAQLDAQPFVKRAKTSSGGKDD